jgi:hypothetical protein
MKARMFKTLFAGALMLSFAAAVSANDTTAVTAEVPFSFTVNNSAPLPPGQYRLSNDGLGRLLVRGTSGGAAFGISNGLHARGQDQAKLVFHKYGDAYVLRQVWTGGGEGRQLPLTHLERELQERKAADAREVVTIAGVR